MNILVVDDELEMLDLVEALLEGRADRVYTARNGKDALDLLARRRDEVDAVITDYVMQDVNGMELLKSIREEHGALPVIMMTGHGEKSLVIEALRNHCNGFLEKPFTRRQLYEELERARVDVLLKAQPSEAARAVPHVLGQMNGLLEDMAEAGRLVEETDHDPEVAAALLERILSRVANMERVAERISQIRRTGGETERAVLPVFETFTRLVGEIRKQSGRLAEAKAREPRPVEISAPGAGEVYKNLIAFAARALAPADAGPQAAPRPESAEPRPERKNPNRAIIEAQLAALRDEIESRTRETRTGGLFLKI
jgi:CheY-like chemotaxis protein